MSKTKVYVDVTAEHTREGRVIPLFLVWEDGRRYEISRVLAVCRAASLKAGGAGFRYTCRILGKETYLYYEEGLWFVERRKS